MNQLQFETSPYLLQHKDNPVNWCAWNKEALENALKEDKLILVSVGYAACHWCHVMEHESFEDEEVAAIMNKYFVAIKVDREERPDVDQIYMNAAQMTSGQGGWPLNVICLPSGKPIYGATYFPKERWIAFLMHFQKIFQEKRNQLEEQADRIVNGIQKMDRLSFNTKEKNIDIKNYFKIWENWKDKLDYEYGGTIGAPKFMMPIALEFLIRFQFRTKNQELASYLKTTLKKMAFGGLHDTIGGGFARYSVDEYWKVPHFEKMLYDNAQLLTVYAHAYQVNKRPIYKNVCEKILDWLEREMTDKNGGLYASLDADTEGVEGKFYCFTYDEILSIIPLIKNTKIDLEKLLVELYNITKEGNFEHKLNVLFRTKEHEYFCDKYHLTQKEFHQLVAEINDKLFQLRVTKIRPRLDDKILTEWNALAVIGLINAYRAFNEKRFIDKAIRITDFVLNELKQEDYRLYRNYKNGKTTINGFLSDYAFLVEALILLYQVTFEEKYLNEAKQFTEYCVLHFYAEDKKLFYVTSDIDEVLIVRSTDSSDNVIPAANSQMVKCLLLLGKYFNDEKYQTIAVAMLQQVFKNVIIHGQYYANWAIALDIFWYQNRELVIVGKNAKLELQKILNQYLPDILLVGSETLSEQVLLKERYIEGKTLVYLCENKSCKVPLENIEDLNL